MGPEDPYPPRCLDACALSVKRERNDSHRSKLQRADNILMDTTARLYILCLAWKWPPSPSLSLSPPFPLSPSTLSHPCIPPSLPHYPLRPSATVINLRIINKDEGRMRVGCMEGELLVGGGRGTKAYEQPVCPSFVCLHIKLEVTSPFKVS